MIVNVRGISGASKSYVDHALRAMPVQTCKALVVRDGHCQAKGCKVPWQFCQPHHINWWTHDGPTDLDNLELLCWHHHRLAHKHDAQPRPG